MIIELGEVVQQFLQEFPNIPSRRIARMVQEKHPEYTLERIRNRVRYYRGAIGVENRNRAPHTFFNQRYDLPIPSVYDSSHFVIKESPVLILADLQFPFQDNEAIGTAIDWTKAKYKGKDKIGAILLNGDVMDCYQLSTFARDPRERKISDELEDCRDFLEMLREEFNVPIYWKFGNHEERFERYLFTHAKDLAEIKTLTLDAQLNLKKYHCTVIKDKRIIKIGHLNVIHGHEYRFFASNQVNPARTFFLRAKAPTLGADRHRTSEHSERTIDDKLITCWSIGCLCQLKARYDPMNNWNHGFAIVKNQNGIFKVQNLRIANGVVY